MIYIYLCVFIKHGNDHQLDIKKNMFIRVMYDIRIA